MTWRFLQALNIMKKVWLWARFETANHLTTCCAFHILQEVGAVRVVSIYGRHTHCR